MQKISSWGLLNTELHDVVTLNNPNNISQQLKSHHPGIAFGMGRSYGDVCLNPGGILWNTQKLDHFIHFDEKTGRLTCEAGVLLRDIQRLFIPRGWMLPVTPGTQLITVGGAIANDVHGKNHHFFGSFGNHVNQLILIRTDGEIIHCESPNLSNTLVEGNKHNSDWFSATVGGLGLTGIIIQAKIQLRRVPGPYLLSETIPYDSLRDFFQLADNSGHPQNDSGHPHNSENGDTSWENTVSWIDCASKKNQRGLFMRANFTDVMPEPTKKPENSSQSYFKKTPKQWKSPLSIPFTPPISLVNSFTLKPFNDLYFYLNKKKAITKEAQIKQNIVHYEPFFYPLDNISNWNRLYGPKGFYQYQSVVSREAGDDVTRAMLKEIVRSGQGSFLSVLKTFGTIESKGMMSFPKPGVTLALDFPNQGQKTLQLFERLDAIVSEAGGRLYPAKDARMPRTLFESGYPRLHEFLKYRDPGISSALSRRLID